MERGSVGYTLLAFRSNLHQFVSGWQPARNGTSRNNIKIVFGREANFVRGDGGWTVYPPAVRLDSPLKPSTEPIPSVCGHTS
ncbi:hypothetical protein J6590_003282 [Homalodisca vitripennis]|nr:hypothetical protein J6590_003282 [Homalodisca vitripennis]